MILSILTATKTNTRPTVDAESVAMLKSITKSTMSELMELHANYSDYADFKQANETTIDEVDKEKAS